MGAFLTGLSITLIVVKMLGLVQISWMMAFTPVLFYLFVEVVMFVAFVVIYVVGLYHK